MSLASWKPPAISYTRKPRFCASYSFLNSSMPCRMSAALTPSGKAFFISSGVNGLSLANNSASMADLRSWSLILVPYRLDGPHVFADLDLPELLVLPRDHLPQADELQHRQDRPPAFPGLRGPEAGASWT